MKRITSFLLAVTLLLSVAPVSTVRAENAANTESTTAPTTQSTTASTTQSTTPSATTESTTTPTTEPTTVPTTEPTAVPTTEPTTVPTTEPTTVPTTAPTTVPTTEPTTVPTTEPTTVPTTEPTTVPTTEPTTVPTTEPTTVPTTEPTTVPTTEPTTVPTTAPTTPPPTLPTVPEVNFDYRVSDECIEIIKEEEGFCKVPYWDFTQYTVGYGTVCPDDMVEYYMQNGITAEEAEVLLRNCLMIIEHDVNVRIIEKYGLKLTQNQYDALVLFSFNCGTSWCFETSGTFHNAIVKGVTGNELIRSFALWCSAGGQVRDYLLRRRLSEANMYLNGIYDRIPPENYCYVMYDANGGTTSPRSQGYNAEWPIAPYPVPTMPGYIFKGWYTAKFGGTKITVLDASTKDMTLYAQWEAEAGTVPPGSEPTPIDPVEITVTATDVNLRQGPGTNYTIVGGVNPGEKLTVTETATGSGYLWGKTEKGWIALQFTDYESVVSRPPEPTTPPVTEPTTPPVTEPTTQPTTAPTTQPTTAPTTQPTTAPTTQPTTAPTTQPTTAPTTQPTTAPTTQPTTAPTTQPTTAPTTQPTTAPTTQPTTAPTTQPTTPTTQPTTPPAPATQTGVVNVQDWLRVRSGPGTSYSVTDYLGPDTRVEILEVITVGATKWGKIESGWVSMDYIVLDKPAEEEKPMENKWTGKVTATELFIRSGPGLTHSIVSYLTQGATVTVTERQMNGSMEWGKIANGWICLDYVKFDSENDNPDPDPPKPPDPPVTPDPPKPPEQPKKWTGVVNVQDCLRVRSGAGTSYGVIGFLAPQQKVTIYERKTVDGMEWGEIDGGWISLDYVILDEEEEEKPTDPVVPPAPPVDEPVIKTVIADCLRVRRGPGTDNNIVDFLYYGARVEIFETAQAADGTLWGRIATGWISMDYTK